MRDNEKIVKSCGNIFADLGLPNADEEMAKAELALAVLRRIDARQLTQARAATLMGTAPAQIARLRRGKLSSFTVGQLRRCLTLIIGLVAALLLSGCSHIHPQRNKIEAVSAQPNRAGQAAPIAIQETIQISPAKPPPDVVYAAISPDGRLGASFYGSGKIRLWNTQTGKLLHTVKYTHINETNYQYESTTAFTFSRNGKWLLIRDNYSVSLGEAQPRHDADVLTVWNTKTGHEVSTPVADNDDSINSFVFTPDDTALVYDCIGKFGTSCTLCKVDLNTGHSNWLSIFQNQGDVNPGYFTQFTPDGKYYKASGFGPDCAVDITAFQSVAWLP